MDEEEEEMEVAPAGSPEAELASLVRARQAEDETYLNALSANKNVALLASNPDNVRLLWNVCRIPDFRKLASDAHTQLLTEIYQHLRGAEGRLPTVGIDWVRRMR